MQDFTIMQPLVDKLCASITTEPENWNFGIYYITSPKHLGSIEIYKDIENTFTKVKSKPNSTTTEIVFSLKQGKSIRNAYKKALSITGSRKQQELLALVELTK